MALNRSQLAKFLPDHESIRQFEQAFSQIGDNTAVTDQLAADLDAAEALIAAQALLISAAQADADSAQLTADAAQTTADAAQAAADAAQADADAAQGTANTSLANAATAQGTANTAVSNAATAQSTANTAVTNAATAQSTANTAVSNAATAQSTANTAVTNAATAQSTANTAVTNAATAQSEIDTHEALTAAHGAAGAVVGTTNTQTLSNKTLSAPVVTGLTNLQGGQIQFPATQNASANVNTLDDYEEGAWVPTATSQGGTLGATTNVGFYTKIGRQVSATFTVTIDAVGTGTGFVRVTLPFNAGQFPAVGYGRESAVTGNMLVCAVGGGAPGDALVYTYNSGSPIGLGHYLVCTIVYFV